jgi:hypothetical protein
MKRHTRNNSLLALTVAASALVLSACPESSDSGRQAFAAADGPWAPLGDVQSVSQKTSPPEGYAEIGLDAVTSLKWDDRGTLWGFGSIQYESVGTKQRAKVGTLLRFQNGAWQKVASPLNLSQLGPVEIGRYAAGQLALDGEGAPVIPYRQCLGDECKVSIIRVYRWNNSAFEEMGGGPASPSDSRLYGPPVLARDKEKRVVVAYSEPNQGPEVVVGSAPAEYTQITQRRFENGRWVAATRLEVPLPSNSAGSWHFAMRGDGTPLVAVLDRVDQRALVYAYEKEQWRQVGASLTGTLPNLRGLQLAARDGQVALGYKACAKVSLGTTTGSAKGESCAFNVALLEGGQWKRLPIASHYKPGGDVPSLEFDNQKRLWFAEEVNEENLGGDVVGQGLRIQRFDQGKWSRVGQPPSRPSGGLLAIAQDGKVALGSASKDGPKVFTWNGN